MPEFGVEALIIFGIVVIIALIVAYISSRYKVASANEALVRSGRRNKDEGLVVVRAGGIFVLPLFHDLGTLNLSARQISVQLTDAVTSQGIKVALEGVATFKVGADETSIRNAAERFLNTDPREVDDIVKNVLEGSLRSIVGTLTVEELNLDRMKFQQAVQGAAISDLATSGLVIDSFTIQAIGGEALEYMELVGRQELARRERDARMAQATADQEASVREATAQEIKLDADRGVQLREADVKKETEAARARANQAGPLAQAKATQEVVEEETTLAELAAERKAKELLTSTVRPAEAEAEAIVKRADGDRTAAIAAAQAEAENLRLRGEADAKVVEYQAKADAEKIRLQGLAEADIIEKQGTAEATVIERQGIAEAAVIAKKGASEATVIEQKGQSEATVIHKQGEAEATALEMRADAYRHFNDAAILATIMRDLPNVVRAASEPIGQIDNLTVLSTDGASEIVKTATTNLTQTGHAVKGLTGIDLAEVFSNALDSTGLTGGDEDTALVERGSEKVETEIDAAAEAAEPVTPEDKKPKA